MSNQFLKLRRSAVPGRIPTTASLDFGEIALNTYDGKAYMKRSGSNGEEVVVVGSIGDFTGSFSGSFTGSLLGTSSWAVFAVNALTASSADNFTVRGTLTAQTIVAQVITSSTELITGSLTVDGALNAPNITGSLFGTSSQAVSSSYSLSSSYAVSSSNSQTASFASTGNGVFSGSFSGSFSGNGSGLTGISASSVVGLNLSLISSGSVTASTDPAYGFRVNSNSQFSGSTQITGSLGVTGSVSISGNTGSVFSANVDTMIFTGSFNQTGSISLTGSLNVFGGITGSLFGTSSWAVSASHAPAYTTTASFNQFTSSYYLDSSSFDTRILANSSSIEILSSSFLLTSSSLSNRTTILENASSSFAIDSGSNSVRITNLESTASVLTQASASFSSSISSLSSSFSSFTNTYNTGSFTGSFDGRARLTGSFTGSFSGQVNGSFSGSISNIDGATNYIAKYDSPNTIDSSVIYQSGSFIAINETSFTAGNPEALYVFQTDPTSFNVVTGKGNSNNYLQLNIQNTNQGISASSDIVATANNGTEDSNYISMGINGENFATNFIGEANDAYVYSIANNLHIGNAATNGSHLGFFVGGDDVQANNKLQLNADKNHSMSGSLDITGSLTVVEGITGSLFGTSSWAISASHAPSSLSSSYAISASYAETASSANNFLIRQDVTASNALILGTLTAQTIVAQIITSSTEFVTGSTRFGSLLTNTHQFTGSVSITGSLSVNNDPVVTQTPYNDFSQSIQLRATNLESTASVLTNASGSFSTRVTTLEAASSSFAQQSGSNSVRFTNLESTASSLTFASASFNTRILNNSSSIAILSSSFLNVSSSNSTRITNLEQFSSSLDATFATDAQLNAATASLSSSIAYLSSSYLNSSASFDTRILNNSSSITILSSSFLSVSSSNSTRITNLEQFSSSLDATFATDAQLNAATASLSASISYLSSSYLNSSASFDTRILNNSSSISQLSSSFLLFSGSYNTGSFTGSFTGSLFGTASWAVSASHAPSALTASYALQALSSSYAITASYAANVPATASYALQALSASYAETASYAANVPATASYALQALSSSYAVTSSFATTASFAVSASISVNAITASHALTASSADNFLIRQNVTASNALITGTLTAQTIIAQVITSSTDFVTGSTRFGTLLTNTHQFTGSVSITGSLSVNNSPVITDSTFTPFSSSVSLRTTNLESTASVLTTASSSFAQQSGSNSIRFTNLESTASVLTVASGSISTRLTTIEGKYLTTGSNVISGSQQITGSIIVTGSISATQGVTASLFGTASWAQNATTASHAVSALTSSYASNAELLDGRDSSVFATTGSNVFRGNQTVTGSLFTTGSNTLVGSTTLTGSLNISGSTTQIGSNNLIGNTSLSGSLIISGSQGSSNPTIEIFGDVNQTGYTRYLPVTTNINTSISASYIYVSGSTNDLYFSQNGAGYSNTTRLRWLEGNLYTGLLNGGLITSQSSTTYRISSGSGIIVNLNASLNDNPYPTIQYLNWGNLTGSINDFTSSYQQAFVGIDSTGNIFAQGTPFSNGQFDTLINIGGVFFQNQTSINAVKTQPSVAYGFQQSQNIFNRAFGPLKLSGYTLAPSGSSTGSLVVGSGTAYAPGSNYTIDPNEPSYTVDNGTNISKIFRYYQSGSSWVYLTNGGLGFTTIDPGLYSNNGTLSNVQPNEWSIQRVFWFPNSVVKAIVVYYGNTVFSTEADAIANINIESFVEAPNTAANAVYLGAIIIRGNGTLNVPADFTIVPGGLFRQVGGSGGGGSVVTQTLSGLSDVSISGPTNLQPFAYSSTAGKWINTSIISASIVGNASTATTASYAETASYVLNAISSSYAFSSSFAISSSIAVSSSFATSASFATTSSFATSASFATTSSFATSASFSTSASAALNALTASHALTASSADGFLVRQNITASNALITGTLTAQTIIAQVITSSTDFVTGSTRFGTLLTNTHQFTGSVSITGSLSVNNSPVVTNDVFTPFSSSVSLRTTNLESTSSVLTSASASFALQSGSNSVRFTNLESTSSALTTASGSFSTRVTTLEVASASFALQSGSDSARITRLESTASVLTTASASFAIVSGSFVAASSSFSTRTTNLETASSSFAQQSGSNSIRFTNLESTASVLTTASASFALVSGSFITASGSFSIRTTNLETASSSFAQQSGSNSLRFTNLESTASVLTTASASFAIVSGSFVVTSGSFSTRVTTLETASASFALQSGSDSARITRLESTASVLTTASASFALVSGSYVAASGSISTRLTTIEGKYLTTGSNVISGSQLITGSIILTGSISATQGVTASLFGTSSWAQNAVTSSYILNAISASFASTASSVNTLNQNVLITGSLTVGATSAGAAENTLIIGPAPAGGAGEGGQLLLQAKGDTGYTSASMLDTWQNQFRILRGTNAASDALIAQWNLHTKQMQLPAYTSPSSFPGTATANLSIDSGGNIITTAIGSSLSGGSTNYIARWSSSTTLTTGSLFDNGTNVGVGNQSPLYKLDVTGDIRATGAVYANANGQMYFRGGDDAELWDINVANTLGVYGQQDQTVASIKLGSGGGTISGRSSNIGIGTINPTSASLTVNGNVWATSFTGSLFGTASWAQNAVTSSYILNAVSASFAATASSADSFLVRQSITASNALITGTLTAQTIVAQVITSSTDFVTGSTRFGSLLTNTHQFTGSVTITGSLTVSGPSTFNGVVTANNLTGSLFGTASWAQNSTSASFAQSTISASYAQTASYANDFTIRTRLFFDQTLTDYATVASSIVGSNNLFTQATGSYSSAFFKYTVSNSTNARTGEVLAVWNGASVEFTDFSTVDLGATSPVTCSVSIVGADVLFNVQTNTSGWRIKSMATFM